MRPRTLLFYWPAPIACRTHSGLGESPSLAYRSKGECIAPRRVTLVTPHTRVPPFGFCRCASLVLEPGAVNGTRLEFVGAGRQGSWASRRCGNLDSRGLVSVALGNGTESAILKIESSGSYHCGRCSSSSWRPAIEVLNSSGMNKRVGDSRRTLRALDMPSESTPIVWRSHGAGSKLSYGRVAAQSNLRVAPVCS
jgi:hypothetical protein